jgi:1-acyl-sn-glycerol-3-phosphate acyltransferase
VTERPDYAWARRAPARLVREAILMAALRPIMALYTRRRIGGRAHVAGLAGPVIFVANHCSHMDTPMILCTLPRRLRRRTAVAAAADYFYRRRSRAIAVSLAFNTVPVQRHGGGLRPPSTQHVERLLDDGWSLLIFAEGTRSRDGSVGRLRSGAAVMAAEHRLPIVPVYVSGTHAAMPVGRCWPRRGRGRRRHPVQVRFGPPLHVDGRDERLAVMERIRLFFAESGATTTPDRRVLARAERAVARRVDR